MKVYGALIARWLLRKREPVSGAGAAVFLFTRVLSGTAFYHSYLFCLVKSVTYVPPMTCCQIIVGCLQNSKSPSMDKDLAPPPSFKRMGLWLGEHFSKKQGLGDGQGPSCGREPPPPKVTALLGLAVTRLVTSRAKKCVLLQMCCF